MTELTYEEFCSQSMDYVGGMVGDHGAMRLYINRELGIARELRTERKRYGDIYSGWKDGVVKFMLAGDDREFDNSAELYVAWMARVCGVKEET